jgi:hypothetical protein
MPAFFELLRAENDAAVRVAVCRQLCRFSRAAVYSPGNICVSRLFPITIDFPDRHSDARKQFTWTKTVPIWSSALERFC